MVAGEEFGELVANSAGGASDESGHPAILASRGSGFKELRQVRSQRVGSQNPHPSVAKRRDVRMGNPSHSWVATFMRVLTPRRRWSANWSRLLVCRGRCGCF